MGETQEGNSLWGSNVLVPPPTLRGNKNKSLQKEKIPKVPDMVGKIRAAHTQVSREDHTGWATAPILHTKKYKLPMVSECPRYSSSQFKCFHWNQRGKHNKHKTGGGNHHHHHRRSSYSGTLPGAAAHPWWSPYLSNP